MPFLNINIHIGTVSARESLLSTRTFNIIKSKMNSNDTLIHVETCQYLYIQRAWLTRYFGTDTTQKETNMNEMKRNVNPNT